MTGEAKPRRVLVDAVKAVSEDRDGIARYGRELLQALVPFGREPTSNWRIDVYLGLWFMFELTEVETLIRTGRVDESIPRAARIVVRLGRFRRRLITAVARMLPRSLQPLLWLLARTFDRMVLAVTRPLDLSAYDVVHVLLPQSAGMVSRSPTRTLVTTIHDLTHASHPEFHTPENVENASKGLRLSIERGAGFIAVSEATRRELLETSPAIDPEDAVTVHEACDRERFAPVADAAALAATRSRYRIPPAAYLLTLSTLEPRKNLVNTIKGFLLLLAEEPELDTVLVIAGQHGWKMEELLDDPTLRSERVVFTGFVEEEDLPGLYTAATALSYVSYWEGFGLPALEAMSCGTPVVYGDRGALPEVVGRAGVPADPSDVRSIRDAFRRILSEPGLRDRLSTEALARAGDFSWHRAARETLAAYQRYLERDASRPGDEERERADRPRALGQTG